MNIHIHTHISFNRYMLLKSCALYRDLIFTFSLPRLSYRWFKLFLCWNFTSVNYYRLSIHYNRLFFLECSAIKSFNFLNEIIHYISSILKLMLRFYFTLLVIYYKFQIYFQLLIIFEKIYKIYELIFLNKLSITILILFYTIF